MLQQTPEYKRLPLHRIHGRRLSAKNFDYSAPDTASHASTAFTKTEPTNVTLASPTAHGGMYYDDPHHHQAPYRDKPVELATTLWPPEATNYWFPNWKELFHGFLVVQKGQKGQTRQTFVANSEQRGGIVCIQSGSPPQCSSTQSLHLGSANANTSIHRVPSSQQSQQHHLQACTNDSTQTPLLIPIPSHDGAHSPAKWQEKDQAQIGEANKACSSSIQAPGVITKCSIKSPLWLPQGWITEIHIRRTGTTAGTRHKYFKHLASGRRFRSRTDVLHFTSTGKGRARNQSRGLMYSAGHSLLKTFAHKKLSILEGLKPSSQSCSENKHSIHVANSMLLGLSESGLNDDLVLPCKQLNSLCSSSGIQSPGKKSAKEKAHKLAVKKKTKTLPSKISCSKDKQASKLWQWLTKPVARDNGTYLNQEVFTVSFSRPDVENAATEMSGERSVKDLSLRDRTAHRAIQLSKEIQAAHDDVVQMSREMQATAEKLSREIIVAKKDAELGHEKQVSRVPTETFVVLAENSEASKGCKPKIETLSRSLVTSSVEDQACKPGVATNKLPNTAQISSFANNSVICRVPGLDHTSRISKKRRVLLQGATCMPETCSTFPLPVNQPITSPNIIMHPEVQMVKRVHAPMGIETQAAKRHEGAFNHAIQPAQTAPVGTFQVPAVFIPYLIPQQTERSPVTKDDATQPALWAEVPMVHTPNSLQMAPVSSGSITKAADGCASKYCEVTQTTDSMLITRSHFLVTNNYLKQPEEVAEVNDAQAARRQTRSMDHPAQVSVILKGQAAPSHGICANANAVVTEKPGISSYGAQQSGAGIGLQETSDSRQSVKWQQLDEIEARRLRRKKFSAVLNPKLDMSRISPSLTTRQRAKVVEKMKARHARELLATLGKHICRKAVRRKP